MATFGDVYRESLNESYEPFQLGELGYPAGEVLRSVDPIAYRCGFNDWTDSLECSNSACDHGGEFDVSTTDEFRSICDGCQEEE